MTRFRCIYSTTDRPSRIYFNEREPLRPEPCLKFIGIEANTPEAVIPISRGNGSHPSGYPLCLNGTTPFGRGMNALCYSYCRMENVVQLTCCVNRTAAHKPIVGILLHYVDGGRSCLGQYRMDWAIDPVAVNREEPLGIRMDTYFRNLDSNPFWYVDKLTVEAVDEVPGMQWLRFPWHGKLEWWFSKHRNILRHFDA